MNLERKFDEKLWQRVKEIDFSEGTGRNKLDN